LIIWGNTALVSYDQIFEDYGTSLALSYSCIEGGWSGVGNIADDPLFVTGSRGDYYLSQIEAGQSAQSPCVDAGDPNSPLLSGTTRTDEVEDQGIVDLGYHYSVSQATAGLWITVNAAGSTTIPPEGGTLDWNIAVGNSGALTETADVWANLTLPSGGSYGPVMGPVQDFTFQPGWSADRDRTLTVPANAPAGVYILNGYIGDFDAGTIIAEDHFTWTKSGSQRQDGPAWFSDSGENFNEPIAVKSTVEDFIQVQTYPEPFNPTVTVTYDLPQAAPVTFNVFDLGGRRVTQSEQGWMEAGLHHWFFDASNLPSGAYFTLFR
jgi:hypothetical protein